MLQSIIRSELTPTLFHSISVLTILCLLIIILNPPTMVFSVMAQTLTLTTTTNTSYHIDDTVSTGHFVFFLLPGDNHCGYMGFRNLHPFENILRDDGAIDIVVRNWSE